MNRLPRLVLLLTLAFTPCVAAQDLGPLVGTWDIEFTFNGNPIQAVLELRHADNALAGTWTGPRGGSDEIESIATDGTTLAFSRQVERQGQTFEISYSATVEDHQMTGTMTTPRGENPFSGRKR